MRVEMLILLVRRRSFVANHDESAVLTISVVLSCGNLQTTWDGWMTTTHATNTGLTWGWWLGGEALVLVTNMGSTKKFAALRVRTSRV